MENVLKKKEKKLTSMVMMRGNGWRVLIPPSIATPKIFLDLRMTTSKNGSSSETANRHPVYMQIRKWNRKTKNMRNV